MPSMARKNSLRDSAVLSIGGHDVFSNIRLESFLVGKRLEEIAVNPHDLETPHWQEAPLKEDSRDISKENSRDISKQDSKKAMSAVQSGESKSPQITSSLEKAKRQAHLRQLRLRIPAVTIGFVLGFLGLYLSVQEQGSLGELFSAYVASPAIYMMFVAFLPSDRRALPIVAATICAPMTAIYVFFEFNDVIDMTNGIRSESCTHRDDTVPCWFVGFLVFLEACQFLCAAMTVLKLIWLLLCRSKPTRILTFLFVGYGCMFLSIGSVGILQGLPGFAAGQAIFTLLQFVGSTPYVLIGMLMIWGTNFRANVQSWFMSRGEEAAAAAAIAELLGESSIEHVLSLARANFLCVRADHITESDLRSSTPDPKLAMHTEKARLGFVDAFFSHSWHDDATQKWEVLQEFRTDFKKKHGREPTLWIDKYCINQDCIDDSLAALPVYLSGCKVLIIACGSTYLKRLWCLVELFVFIEMGGKISNLEVKLLDHVKAEINGSQGSQSIGTNLGPRSHSLRELMSSEGSRPSMMGYLMKFDPREAICFTEYDTQRLHAVIQTTGYEKMIDLVTEVFVDCHTSK